MSGLLFCQGYINGERHSEPEGYESETGAFRTVQQHKVARNSRTIFINMLNSTYKVFITLLCPLSPLLLIVWRERKDTFL